MGITKLSIAFIFLSCMFFNSSYSQGKDNYVQDTTLNETLRKYLLEHIDVYTFDSSGKKVPMDATFIKEEYGNVLISASNLKTDSIIDNKEYIGIYKFQFACYDGCRPHLYIQYHNSIDFIDLDSKDFNLDKLLRKITRFFKKYPNQFSLQEKVKTLQGVMETIYFNKFAEYGW